MHVQVTSGASRGNWLARLSAVVVWAAVGFGVAWGVLRWVGQTPPVALPALPLSAPDVDTQAVARALGAVPVASGPVALPAPDVQNRYALVGVVAEKPTGAVGNANRRSGGVALITVDAQRARPYAVGTVVDGRWVVHQVGQREVVLRAADGRAEGASLTLALPKPQ